MKKNILSNIYVRLFIAAFVIFAGVLLYLPSAGVVRSLPFIAIFPAVATIFHKDRRVVLGLTFVLCFAELCVEGLTLNASLFYSVAGGLFAYAGIYVFSLGVRFAKAKKNSTKRQCMVRIVPAVLVALVMYVFVCGNVFSAFSHSKSDRAYIKTSYNDLVRPHYTYYSLLDFAYRTSVTFEDNGAKLGKSEEYYVSKKNGVTTDGFRDYAEKKMLYSSEAVMKSLVGSATDAFEISGSQIEFGEGELLSLSSVSSDYYDRTDYAVSIYSIVDDKKDFAKICSDVIKTVNSADSFDYGKIIFVGGNTNAVKFSLEVTPDTTPDEISGLVKDFGKDTLSEFSLTEKDVLSYWVND